MQKSSVLQIGITSTRVPPEEDEYTDHFYLDVH